MSAKPAPVSAEQWRERAAAIRPRSQVFIDGKFAPAASGATFDNLNPATGRSLGAVSAGEQADIDRAVASARVAFHAESGQRSAARAQTRAANLADSMRLTKKSSRCSRRSTPARPSATA